MTNEDIFVFIGCILGAFIVYKIFLMFWTSSTIEGLENQQVVTTTNGLLANSDVSLATAKKMLEISTNDLLLNNSTYNTNYSTKCTTMYDVINLQMVKIVAGLDPSGSRTLYMRGLSDLNILFQAKIALNDTLKTIDAVETIDSDATATSTTATARNGLMSSVGSLTSSF